jgi:hypothetical protein
MGLTLAELEAIGLRAAGLRCAAIGDHGSVY